MGCCQPLASQSILQCIQLSPHCLHCLHVSFVTSFYLDQIPGKAMYAEVQASLIDRPKAIPLPVLLGAEPEEILPEAHGVQLGLCVAVSLEG